MRRERIERERIVGERIEGERIAWGKKASMKPESLTVTQSDLLFVT